jgi:hypothetical protein
MGVSNTVQQLSVFLENISGLTEFIFLRKKYWMYWQKKV